VKRAAYLGAVRHDDRERRLKMDESRASSMERIPKLIGLLGLLGIAGAAGLANPRLYALSSLSFLSYVAYFRFFRGFLGHRIVLPPERIPILILSMFAPSAAFFMASVPAVGFVGFFGFLGYTLDIEVRPQAKTQ
jgi:hypothetical protein